jgi:hydroxymethylpyrimidine pyrophosphatase-like HAD family hydrolase
MQREKDRTVTLFIDIDGTIFRHQGNATNAFSQPEVVLNGVLEKFNEWSGKGYCIILTTARKESMRAATEAQLLRAGLFWDHLIMGVGMGRRIVLNDKKVVNDKPFNTAIGINLVRNEGLENVDKYFTNELNHLGEEGEFEI